MSNPIVNHNIPVEQILREAQPKLEYSLMSDAANERAIREPLPSNTVKAFVPDEIIVSISPSVNIDGIVTPRSVKIRKSTALDIYIFKLTGSPIYKLIMGDVEETKSGDIGFNQLFAEESLLFDIIYQFTHKVEDVYSNVSTNLEEYKRLVILNAGKYSIEDTILLVSEIMNHIKLTNDSRVAFSSGGNTNDTDKKKEE